MEQPSAYWVLLSVGCAPSEVPAAARRLLNEYSVSYPNTRIKKVEHQTCSIGSPNSPQIFLSLLVEFE